MPLPKPSRRESKPDFIDRFMSDDIMENEFPDVNQRLATANKQWLSKFKANQLTVNKSNETPDGVFSSLKANFSPHIRYSELEGRKHVVVPTIMLNEGVLNGSAGPKYYPDSETSITVKSWDHKPICVNHPTNNSGQPIPACSKEAIDTHKIGILMNTKHENSKLKTESWIDYEKAMEVDERIIQNIEAGQMMEVSTGLYTHDVPVEGTFNGNSYDSVATCYNPDHLAILPDSIGACSIKDGAGLLRVNEKGETIDTNEFSNGNIENALERQIKERYKDAYIVNVFSNHFIFETYDANVGTYRLWRMDFTKNEDGPIVTDGDPVEVQANIQYKQVNNEEVVNNESLNRILKHNKENQTRKDDPMSKEQIISDLVANDRYKWTEEDKETLNSMDEKILEKMIVKEEETESGKTEENEDAGKQTAVEDTQEVKNNEENQAELLRKTLGDDAAGFIANSLKRDKEAREALVQELFVNKANKLSKDQLGVMNHETLNSLKESYKAINFGGQGVPVATTNALKPSPLPDPYAKSE